MRVRLTKPITRTAITTIPAGTIVNLNRGGDVLVTFDNQYVHPRDGAYEAIAYEHEGIPLVEGRQYDVTVQHGSRGKTQTLRGWFLATIETRSWNKEEWWALTFRKSLDSTWGAARRVYVDDLARLEPVNG